VAEAAEAKTKTKVLALNIKAFVYMLNYISGSFILFWRKDYGIQEIKI
jgi:hypothetical protein